MSNELSRRQFLAGATAFALGSAVFGLPCRAFADDAQAGGAIVILHTNDVHCAVGEADEKGATPLGYSALASYVADRKGVFGNGNVTLVDAGDAVQGNVMGTLTQGQALVDIMNATGYDYVIPGNHEFDYGMPQFNHLVGSANATYLSCNFTDKRPEVPTLMFAPYAIQAYSLAGGGTARVAFVGVTTPATLTASSPKSFWRSDDDHTCVYGFCEDDTGAALAAAVQNAVDQARTAGADYVVLLAHLGQDGSADIWRSDALAKRCRGIDVIIDGHSHQEYVQVIQDAEGKTSSSRKRARSFPAWARSLSTRTAEPSPPARPPSRPRFCARPAKAAIPHTCRRRRSGAMPTCRMPSTKRLRMSRLKREP